MTSSISWIDPKRWNELLRKAGFEPVDSPETAEPDASPEHARARVWVERLLERAATLNGAEAAFLVDRFGSPLARSATAEGPEVEDLASTAADLIEVLEARRRRGDAPQRGMGIVSLGGSRRLHVVEALSGGERFGLGVVADRTLSDRELVDLQLRLGQALG